MAPRGPSSDCESTVDPVVAGTFVRNVFASRSTMAAVTNYSILATQAFTGAGSRLHSAQNDGFLTLMLHRGRDNGSNPPDILQEPTWLRVTIGLRDHELWLEAKNGVVLSDWPIGVGEEVWVAVSQPSEFVVSGFQTPRPM
jgi:hypothetical protein